MYEYDSHNPGINLLSHFNFRIVFKDQKLYFKLKKAKMSKNNGELPKYYVKITIKLSFLVILGITHKKSSTKNSQD